jgi:hypothetical protein
MADAAKVQTGRWERKATVAALVICIGIGLLVGYVIWGRGGSTDPFATPASKAPPGEYLYLDSPRVVTYLSQVEDGLKSGERVTLSRTQTAGGSVTAGGIGLQGTAQSQRSLEETVTPTETSLFYRLEARLRDHRWLEKLNATPANFSQFRTALANVDEGSFVEIHNCRLVLPAYAIVYRGLKQRIPTLPLTLTVQAPLGEKNVELLFPVAYSSLANEPSLYSTRLTVLGKVIRQVDEAHPLYIDSETNAAFDFDLEHEKKQLRRAAPQLGVRSLENAFRAAVTVDAPGTVILPIAIFK